MRFNSMLLLILLLFPALACQEEEVKLVPIDPNVIDIIAEGKKRCESAVASFPIREKLEPVLSAFEEQYGHAVSVPTDYYGDVTAAAVKLKLFYDDYEFIFSTIAQGWTSYIRLPVSLTCDEENLTVIGMASGKGKASVQWNASPEIRGCPRGTDPYFTPFEIFGCESPLGGYINSSNYLPKVTFSVNDGSQSTSLEGFPKANYVSVTICRGQSCEYISTSTKDFERAVEAIGEPPSFTDFMPKRIASLVE